MTFRNLLEETTYKRVFNSIYKQYLKEYSKNKVELFAVNLQRSFDLLKKINKKECKNIIKIEMLSGVPNVYICNEDDCAIMDFMDWQDLVDCEVVAPKSLSTSRVVGEILWDITFWGYTPEQIRKNKDEINERSKNGESFPLQEFRKREHRLE